MRKTYPHTALRQAKCYYASNNRRTLADALTQK
jgi:hypothetical protein